MKKGEAILNELREHLPFTLGASLVAGVLVAVFYLIGQVPSEELFEVLHPAHVLVSAVATSAVYYKYRGSGFGVRGSEVLKSVLVGASGAILVGTLSDVLFPWLAGRAFSLKTTLHLPLIEEPVLILGVALAGAVLGMYSNLFKISHYLHVFLSVFASLFYLLAFSVALDALGIMLISGIVFLAVYVPCCISDIIFPLLFLDKPCAECQHWH